MALLQHEPTRADTGAEIFASKCAECHGDKGQGNDDGYDQPLFGEHSIDVLAKLIERTMPEDDPEGCVGDEAKLVAEYIYNEFYSLAARQRKGLVAPPRIELSRLTVSQYRNAVADLLRRFTPDRGDDTDPQPGLRAKYYQSKGMSKADQQKQDRVDPLIDFDFQEASPAEDIAADQFAIVWNGTLIAEDTGYYEFRVSTENGARLYLNNDQTGKRTRLRDDSSLAGQSALIDAWVSSGKMRELTARVFLLGGRGYPIRLEFFKYKEKTSSIKLEWKPPHGAWSVLDHNHMTTETPRRTFVVTTPFPADDRSLGYERGSSVSREWHVATNNAAIETAGEVMNRLPLLAGINDDDNDRKEKLREFLLQLAAVAFRRPLTEVETALIGEAYFADSETPDLAVQRAVLFVLKSPHFLYTDLMPDRQNPDQHTIAARLSFALWDSIPDGELEEWAKQGKLADQVQVASIARKMLDSPQTKAKLHQFFHHWLELDERDMAKDEDQFPNFDQRVIADLRYSLTRFVDDVVWSDNPDYRKLLTADYLLLNRRLGQLYRANSDDQQGKNEFEQNALPYARSIADDFQAVSFSPDERSGVLTHPYLLSAFAYHDNTSPIHRGVFLTRNVVGRALKPPPIAVAFKDDEFEPNLSMREKITQLTSDKSCISCHSVINPLGFALENYDAVGRWRTRENEQPIETKSQYVTELGETIEFEKARDIAEFAVNNESAHRAFVTQLFRHMVKQNPNAYGDKTIENLRSEFAEDSFNVQNLMVRIAVIVATHGQPPAIAKKSTP